MIAFPLQKSSRSSASSPGFSLIELLVSVSLISLLMGAVFSFMYQCQKRFQGNSVVAESNQTARAALEVMSQEIGQAGYNPQFYPNKTTTSSITAGSAAQCVTLNNLTKINPQDWVQVDAGPNEEFVQITGTSNNGVCTSPNQVQGVFLMSHTPSGSPAVIPFTSYKFPYPTGILIGTGVSDDHTLLFYGDTNDDGTIRYVKYSLNPTTSPATTVSITTGGFPGTYTLYNLYRSVTPVGFPATTSAGTNNPASVIVQNVLYNINTTTPALSKGPAGQALFAYPQEYTLGIIPNQISVVGTLVITLSVAVNPHSLETGITQWYTMATQIRPLNLAAAVAVNQSGGGKYMSKLPNDLPMNDPTNYYQ
jgi:prepilin-type N-terminal cleavage/methylation domain-containing protein